MKQSIIATHDVNLGIGNQEGVPWKIPAIDARFEELTIGRPVIMGRRTWEMRGSSPFRGRANLVLTSQPQPLIDAYMEKAMEDGTWVPLRAPMDTTPVVFCRSFDRALFWAEKVYEANEVISIGGAQIFEEAIKTAHNIYLNIVYHFFDCDSHFPWVRDKFDKEWEIIWSEIHPEEEDYQEPDYGPYNYTFYTMKRRPLGLLKRLSNWMKKD